MTKFTTITMGMHLADPPLFTQTIVAGMAHSGPLSSKIGRGATFQFNDFLSLTVRIGILMNESNHFFTKIR